MRLRPILLTLATFAFSAVAHAQGQLQSVLAEMDKASASFQSARADVHQEFYEKVIHAVSTVQNGSVYFVRKNGQTGMGAVMSDVGSSAKPQVIQYSDNVLKVFSPALNQVDVFKAKAGQADSFLTLGFGGSGKDLAASWNVSDAGSETIAGVKTEKLELTPKDAKIAANFDKITLWIDPARGISLRQVFHTPEGDYRTANYSNIKMNAKVDTAAFAMHPDKATKIVTH
ncbi:Outer membrane lipoprotein-sorting protein [Bryocella elongata]|uniref:Outer membrane lipoprotein-sorting protein n=1 Tax=Bryocella elongata TaxID=863522 RepID=A0A1H5TFK3_9BACT|nr:outer membrane lipoprotein-sorting protein [Bryocella elongata]SEF61632.1 Outer membrane lipoprotein-sorting protein [Bryocella elongata]